MKDFRSSNGVKDEEILAAPHLNARERFDLLFGRYKAMVYTFVSRMVNDPHTADDVFQQTFINVYRRLDQFRGEASFKTWLMTIAVNAVRDAMRKRQAEHRDETGLEALLESRAYIPDRAVEQEEINARVRLAIADLPPQQRELFLLIRYHGVSFVEAARTCHVSLSAAKMSVYRAQKTLAESLNGICRLEETP